MSDATAAAPAGHQTGFGSKGYRTYVLILLMAVYTLNFIDRTLIAVVAEPIIRTFELTDSQWGLLYGPPFALFYAVMGLPIAMWADRSNRVKIITACIILWSVMTALCGVAMGFTTLLLFRIGVAVGEAGCTPPANSIIGDYFIPKSRSTALGIYSMGVTLGGVLANLFGGPIAELAGDDVGAFVNAIGFGGLFGNLDWSAVEGWRVAFVVVGVPGVLIALIVMFTIKEPPRGYSDPPDAHQIEKASVSDTMRELMRKPSFWWMALGASLVAFVGYGLVSFQAPFLQREHGLGVRDAAVNYGAPLSFFAAIGTFLGGVITEKMSKRSITAIAIVPAVGLLIAIPAYISAFYSANLSMVFIFWAIGATAHYAYLGAQYNIGQGVVSSRSRATAVAVLLILVSIIGNGIGPYFVGFFSDLFMSMNLHAHEFGQGLTVSSCRAREGFTDNQIAACTYGTSQGLKQSISLTVCWFFVAAFAFFMSARTLKRDFVANIH